MGVTGPVLQHSCAHNIDSCPEGNGIGTIAITWDAKYLATISDAEIQDVCIWRWTLAVEMPTCTLNLLKEYGVQNYLTINPTNNKELVSNSKTQAIYYLWYEEGDILAHRAPHLTEKVSNASCIFICQML
ncbi:cilia- and flagella-associated protein 251-like [Lutra lutra]|uniref:cilia- and flagella-associated protein 251-like n=1 Tax=Lutra lutra TaxID=9657 RepID=UPI001FD29885|nr:cilia- and flagella-associated protein 251-like [Lutra lutra]